MRLSIAVVTGATTELGFAVARLLAAEGCHQVIVTGRSRARVIGDKKRVLFTVRCVPIDRGSSGAAGVTTEFSNDEGETFARATDATTWRAL